MAAVSWEAPPREPLLRGPIIDQYAHGVLVTELGLRTFETRLAAATGCGIPADGTFYDSPHGLALRRWCPPLLGLEPHCSPVRYLARRREMGTFAASRALLRGSGIGCFLVADYDSAPDEGHTPSDHGAPDERGTRDGYTDGVLCSPGELAAASGARVGECIRLETLAAQVADTSGTVRGFVANTAEALYGAAERAVAFGCEAAFLEGEPPGPQEVHRVAGRWLRTRPAGGAPSGEPALLRHLVWSALVTGRSVQLRCGDPGPLARFLRATAGRGPEVVLLPRAPHHRAAARLAAAFPHVYADVGPSPAGTLAEAPFGKLLFSSGARALPELYVVRARAFTAEMERLLSGWTREGVCSRADAVRIAGRIAHGNARRLYRL